MRPLIALSAIAASKASFRLRPTHAGSPLHPAESGSSPTDWSFIASCSPPHLAVTQLLLITELWLSPTRTFTVLFTRLHRRTCASFLSASYGLKTGYGPPIRAAFLFARRLSTWCTNRKALGALFRHRGVAFGELAEWLTITAPTVRPTIRPARLP